MKNKEIAELVMSNPEVWTREVSFRDDIGRPTCRSDRDLSFACAIGMCVIVGRPCVSGRHLVVVANDTSQTAEEAARKIWWLDEEGGAK